MVILSTIITVLLTIVAIGVRLALISAQVALKAAETSLRVANRVSDKAIRKGKKVVDKAGKKAVKEVSSVHKGAGDAASKGHKAVSAVGDVAVNTAIAAKRAAVLALRLLMKALRWVLHLLDGIVAALCAVSTVLIVVIIMVIVMIFAAFGAIVPIGAGAGGFTASTSVTVEPTKNGDNSGVTASFEGWSTKGKTSVPHYVQWYANTDAELAFRDEHMKANGTGSGDWANLPYNGGDVAGNACGACALANAISGQLKQEITPDIIVSFLNSKGLCTVSNAVGCVNVLADKYTDVLFMDINGDSPKFSCWNCGEMSYKPTSRTQSIDMDKVDEWLDMGACLVFSIGPNTAWGGRNNSGHFVCCYGRDSDGYYVTDSRFFAPYEKNGVTVTYGIDEPMEWEQVFTGGVQGPFVVIHKDKYKK